MKRISTIRPWAVTSAAVALLTATVAAGPARAGTPAAGAAGRPDLRERVVTMAGAPAAGPAAVDKLSVIEVGPATASKVLVLIDGRGEAAGGFLGDAQALVERTPGLQVWAVDRREQNLADLSRFAAPPGVAAAYYLGNHYQAKSAATAPYVADWGLGVELDDVRQVVLAARDHGRRQVVLGGHSLGATAVLDYAAWDFDGHPGYQDLSGLMLMDGGVRDALSGAGIDFSITEQGAEDWLAQIRSGQIFDNATSEANNFGDQPQAAAIWYQLIGSYAIHDPHGRSPIQNRLPASIRPDRSLTNAGLLGWVMDQHAALPGYAVTSGHLDAGGDWVDDGPTPISRVAAAFAGPDPAAWEWYYPNRLALDYFGSANFAQDQVADLLGLRLYHTHDIDLPLYVFQSSLTHGTTGSSAQAVAAQTKIPHVEVHTDNSMTHLDILFAAPRDNSFVETAVPFLRGV